MRLNGLIFLIMTISALTVRGESSIVINQGLVATSGSEVILSLSSAKAARMKISENPLCIGGHWQDFKPTLIWKLSKKNQQIFISAQFAEESGAQSACVSSEIFHDSRPPDVALGLDPANNYIEGQTVRVHFSAQDPGVGLEKIECRLNTAVVPCDLDSSGDGFADFQTGVGTFFFWFYASDKLGNSSIEQIGWSISPTTQ
jgi:hypothetical protein